MASPLHIQFHDSPVGCLLLAADAQGLRCIEFPNGRNPAERGIACIEDSLPPIESARRQLDEYFAGRRRSFDLALDPQGTAFQLEVWQALRDIPYGETWSYADIARRLDRPTATRAVGAANGRNPLPIVVPCHRVIGADGSLTGFSGGLAIKQALLELEGALPQRHIAGVG
jgi:methylated-DNA-[protein]-cysteine S-methyltransferase